MKKVVGYNDEPTLGKKDCDIFYFIKNYKRIKGISPSVREIGDAVGLSSPSSVYAHLVKLKKLGKINFSPRIPRSVCLVSEDL